MAKKHFVLTKVNQSFVSVRLDENKKSVLLKVRGQEVLVRDLMKNDRIYDIFAKYCYGYGDPNMIKTIDLDSAISGTKVLTISVVSALVQEQLDEKIATERAEREAKQSRKAGTI